MGRSLWLVPAVDSPSTLALDALVSSLAQEHASPRFIPHVTLASVPDEVTPKQVHDCANSLFPVSFFFEDVCAGTTFYQSIYIAIKETPTLKYIQNFVQRKLKVVKETPNFPHMSLCYGESDRGKIIDNLKEDGKVIDVAGGGVIVAASSMIEAAELWLVDTTGSPDEWNILLKVFLSDRRD
ncbi:hypothetical protein M422DRAFT_68333 [Sphaerobolus stellatus SS14]|uniref:2',3'-cyclic-nucleotide 3'-phosphodiesterase n=1 Tax=Sphaerobolus stellatus (strain SS14) TaxID=990650 RepID=A0A0C9VTA3_SPHS4|nr:hypothetical protein M422DRAFT_68333 [Sphaerobolus stellatus SS14]